MPWTAARAAARALGGHLVTITSAGEQAWIKSTFIDGNTRNRSLWIGLRQDTAPYGDAWARDARWHWVTGEALAYTNWPGNQPDDWPGAPEDNGENFGEVWVSMWGKPGFWNDLADSPPSYWQPDGYIVEWETRPAPVLSWAGAPGFRTDGVSPDSGQANSTLFTFKVKLTRRGGGSGTVTLILRKDGVLWETPSMTAGAGSIASGRIYHLSRRLPLGTYAYRFRARVDGELATGPPTSLRAGPVVTAPAPVLSWAGTPGFERDGVDPDRGQAKSTLFTFKVKLTRRGGGSGSVTLILRKDGVLWETPTMTAGAGSIASGRIYHLSRRLPLGTYAYRFRGRVDGELATGPPTSLRAGPVVTAPRPVLELSWTGERGYVRDGVDPDVGRPGKTRPVFRVRLTDTDGDEPDFVRLILRRNDSYYLTREMTAVDPSRRTDKGRIYFLGLSSALPAGVYRYRFAARDEDGSATGAPTCFHPGPRMRPELLFSRQSGLRDGVRPDVGASSNTLFLFKVVYRDNDGDPAGAVQVVLRRHDGKQFTLLMRTNVTTPDPMAGVPYLLRCRLRPGQYSYRFEAWDRDGEAVGPPTQWRGGLEATSSGAAMVGGLVALPTASGAQIHLNLSSQAEVQARVLNAGGRQVRTLCRARECAAGANTLLWNAQSDTGVPVPNGVYLVEVTATAADGTSARAMAQVNIRR